MSVTESNVLYFGESWGSPLLDGARRVPTPVGERCFACKEPISEQDQGLVRIVLVGGGILTSHEVVPVHAECEALGIVGHQFGVCSCTGYDTTSRESARVLWQRLGDPAYRTRLTEDGEWTKGST